MVVFVTTSFWALAGAASAYSCGYFGLEVSCGFSVMFDRSRPVQRLKYQAFLWPTYDNIFLRDFTDVLDQYKVWHIRHKGGELVIVLFFCWTRGIIIIKKIKWALCKYTCTWGGQEWTISRTFSYERNRTRIFLHGLSLIIERNRTHKTIGKINLIERIAFD